MLAQYSCISSTVALILSAAENDFWGSHQKLIQLHFTLYTTILNVKQLAAMVLPVHHLNKPLTHLDHLIWICLYKGLSQDGHSQVCILCQIFSFCRSKSWILSNPIIIIPIPMSHPSGFLHLNMPFPKGYPRWFYFTQHSLLSMFPVTADTSGGRSFDLHEGLGSVFSKPNPLLKMLYLHSMNKFHDYNDCIILFLAPMNHPLIWTTWYYDAFTKGLAWMVILQSTLLQISPLYKYWTICIWKQPPLLFQ